MNWSFQMFSARHTPLSDALRIIKQAGYSSVEAYRDNFIDVDAFRNALNDNELSVPSMHVNIDRLRDDSQGSMQLARDFTCEHIVCPYLEASERPVDANGWDALGAELADFARQWRAEGFTFAWHNHDFEFVALPDGTLPMQRLLDAAPQMQWELDAAWVVRAGADPAPWIERHAARISAVHLKDVAATGTCEDEDGWADLGYGVVPWDTLMPLLAKAPAQLYAVEHDNPSDLKRFATRSIEAARQLNKLSTNHS